MPAPGRARSTAGVVDTAGWTTRGPGVRQCQYARWCAAELACDAGRRSDAMSARGSGRPRQRPITCRTRTCASRAPGRVGWCRRMHTAWAALPGVQRALLSVEVSQAGMAFVTVPVRCDSDKRSYVRQLRHRTDAVVRASSLVPRTHGADSTQRAGRRPAHYLEQRRRGRTDSRQVRWSVGICAALSLFSGRGGGG